MCLAYHKLIRAVHTKFDHSAPHHGLEPVWNHHRDNQYRRHHGTIQDDEAEDPLTTASSLMYIVCTEYISFTEALWDLDYAGIRHAQYYSSAVEDLGCALAALNTEQRRRLAAAKLA